MVLKEDTMTITTDYTVQNEIRQYERELFDRLERRRIAAERGAEQFGSRLAYAAHLARRGRRGRYTRAA
jgi:hypothetical protein